MTPPIAAEVEASRSEAAIADLLREFDDPETKRLVHGAIERALSQGRYLDECRADANEVANIAASYQHIKAAPCIDVDDCPACFYEADHEHVLAVVDRQRLLLMGKAVSA